jgi:antitoxin MazE
MNVRNSDKMRCVNLITKLRGRSQITLPNEVIKKMGLNPGDNLDISIEDDKIVVKPVLIIDRSQSWFWSKEWQEKEKEVEEDIKAGRITKAKSVDELIEKLES